MEPFVTTHLRQMLNVSKELKCSVYEIHRLAMVASVKEHRLRASDREAVHRTYEAFLRTGYVSMTVYTFIYTMTKQERKRVKC